MTDPTREDLSQRRPVSDWLLPVFEKYESGTYVFASDEDKENHLAALLAANMPLIESEIPFLETSTRDFEYRKRRNGTKRKVE